MSKLDLSKIKKVHFVGIGGIGISAVARMMKLEGKTVIANDIEEFEMVAELRKLGVDTKIGIKKEFVEADTDLYVYSIAWDTIGPKFLEYIRATGKPVLSYPEMLHIVTEGKYTIAVTGTHGKTTTTAMIGEMLMGLDKDPSIIVGSLLKDKNKGENSNLVVGQSDLFVVEGCEYRRSFLNISPKILVITNIEADHLDYYKDLQDVEKAFCEIMQKVPDDGTIILNEKLTARSTLLVQCAEKAMKRGVKMVDYMQYVDKVPTLKIPGVHNKKNAACALAVAEVLKLEMEKATQMLAQFSGTWRRFEFKGTTDSGVAVYDDYAHHPTEIMATLAGLRELFPDKKVTAIFQPHLFSRTKSLFKEFSESFNDADRIILLPIYKAREFDDGTVSSEKLMEEIVKKGKDAIYFDTFEQVTSFLHNTAGGNDVVITLGAGDVYHVGEQYLKSGAKK